MPAPRHEARAAQLRHHLVDRLVVARAITSEAVEAAFRTVPRHLFVPGLSLESAYANDVALIRRDRRGVPTSSVSAPDIQAVMLEQTDLAPGLRVLEIGSGGYNAALAAELVGPSGAVTTVDIDPDVVERARRCLDEAGYGSVDVVLGDAESGVPEHAPYDRILVTVEAWDLPPAWLAQLAPAGRVVVPLRVRGLTRSLALDLVGDHLVSRSSEPCGFVKMQGAGERAEHGVLLADTEIHLLFDEVPPPDPAALDALDTAARSPRAEAWSDILAWRGEGWDTLPFWLATVYPGFCHIAANPDHDTGLIEPALRWGSPAAVAGASFAYLTARPAGEGVAELGAHAFGPDAPTLAEHFARQIRVWDHDHRDGPGPEITVWPLSTRMPRADMVVPKQHTRVAIRWRTSGY